MYHLHPTNDIEQRRGGNVQPHVSPKSKVGKDSKQNDSTPRFRICK